MNHYPNEKTCYCHTCGRWFHYLGIAKHRQAHQKRGQDCKVTYTNGDTWTHPGWTDIPPGDARRES